MDLPPIRVPDDWAAAIDSRRGKLSLPDYIRRLIIADQPKKVRAQLSPPPKRGRPSVGK